eukprot:5057590-Amphidinium_carterae.1
MAAAPAMEYVAPAPAQYMAAAAPPMVEYVAPAPIVEYVAPAPAQYMAAAPPMVEYVAPVATTAMVASMPAMEIMSNKHPVASSAGEIAAGQCCSEPCFASVKLLEYTPRCSCNSTIVSEAVAVSRSDRLGSRKQEEY